MELTVLGVSSYDEASRVSRELVENGIKCIELCGGFGHKGVAKIIEAVKGEIPIGVVRFDCHPGLEGKSGDAVFK